ncbi:MAG: hypothetical protein JNJ54_27815 [Myxococcaceae bacterium]|nr:hypothetical protein [Myxococcaceae bacterium]
MCATGSCVAGCGADGGGCNVGTACVTLSSGGAACATTTCTSATENSTCSLGSGRAGRCCASACVDLSVSSPNCGACGNVCAGTTQCLSGTCQTPANCATATVGVACSVDGGPGVCCDRQCIANPRNSDNDAHCGACGSACPSQATCANGTCVGPDGGRVLA